MASAIASVGCYTGFEGPGSGGGPGADDGASGASAGESADTGEDDSGGPDDPGEPGACPEPDAPKVPLRRLTNEQYDNTVAELLRDSTQPARAFAQDEQIGAFASNIAAVSGLAVEQYMTAAETLATAAVQDLDALLPCSPATLGEDECAAEFIAEFGLRAYRRPLSADELARAQALYDTGRTGADFENGIRLVTQGMLQSPHFLYHFEHGVEGDDPVVALSAFEVANRLSYFIWGSMPDEALLAAAAADELQTRKQVEEQAWRMLASAKADGSFGSFHRQWLDLDAVATADKDPEMFANWTPELADAMTSEAERFGSYVIREDDGLLATLFTATYTIADAELAALYGVDPPTDTDADGFGVIQLDPAERAGLITQAGWLAGHSHSNQTSPVFRGKLIREQMLCQPLPQPPDNVDDTPPAIDPDATAKERFDQLLQDPVCAACHIQMNPIGFGLENYDAVGAFRTMDGNVPVDAEGELIATDVDGPFDGALELAERLGSSEFVAECVATQWTRFATGRIEQAEDECAMDEALTTFAESDHNIQELIVAIAKSNTMRFLRRTED